MNATIRFFSTLLFCHFLSLGSGLCGPVTESFETGFSVNDTAFSADGGDFVFDTHLVITKFETFGSGSGDWFVDTGFGESRSGSVGSLSLTTSGLYFYLHDAHFWTSADGGIINATGDVTLVGTRPDSTTFSSTLTVVPTGFNGSDWDTTNDFSSFVGVPLKSVEFQLGSGINYMAIDEISLETTAIPEPSAMLLLLSGVWLLRSLRRFRRG